MTTKRQASNALSDLAAAIDHAREVLEDVRAYWREDADMSRMIARNYDSFAESAGDLLKRVQNMADDLEDDEFESPEHELHSSESSEDGSGA